MQHRSCIVLIAAALTLAACDGGSGTAATGNPDLLPIPQITSYSPLSYSFCTRDEAGLHVTVRNQGGSPAGPSVTRVDFGNAGGPFDIATAALDPTDSVVLVQPIPAACFNPDCSFTISVNHTGTVDEGTGGDGNNDVGASCIG